MRILRNIRTTALFVIGLSSAVAFGQTVTDGDTLRIDHKTYRLFGIDAPESAQVCFDGWPAGRLAATKLQELIAGRPIQCQARDTDRYGRAIAVCFVDGQDVGALLVRDGYAWAFTRYSSDYQGAEALAKKEKRGVHAHACQPAWEWRAQRRR